ncbi:MAG: desulfoferrodoxin [Clostridia bacterium]|nr:desulfoferrodoxin [Clostridia bacterium]
MKFYQCDHCKNIIVYAYSKGVPVFCCGEKMKELVPGTVDAAKEKHIPEVAIDGNLVKVKVGSVTHPMTEEHHIAFIVLETDKGFQKKDLDPTGAPEAVFALADGEKPVAVYEYCNLHGLWVSDDFR